MHSPPRLALLFSSLSNHRNFDWDGDDRWQSYVSNLTFPPGRDDLVLKKKAQWYQSKIEEDFDINTVLPPSPPTTSPTATATATPPSSQSTHAPKQPQQQPQSTQPQRSFGDFVLLFFHIIVILSAILAVQPFDYRLSRAAFGHFTRASVYVHSVRLFRRLGRPPFSLTGLRTWFSQAATTTEFFYIILTMLLSSNTHVLVGVAPPAILATYHVAAALRTLLPAPLFQRLGLTKAHAWLATHQQRSLELMAVLEIGTGFTLVLGALKLGPRALLPAYMFFNQLRMRYWSSDSRSSHLVAWAKINQLTAPLLGNIAVVQKVVGYGKQWFESAGDREHQQ